MCFDEFDRKNLYGGFYIEKSSNRTLAFVRATLKMNATVIYTAVKPRCTDVSADQ